MGKNLSHWRVMNNKQKTGRMFLKHPAGSKVLLRKYF
jgi:hypothetical protein